MIPNISWLRRGSLRRSCHFVRTRAAVLSEFSEDKPEEETRYQFKWTVAISVAINYNFGDNKEGMRTVRSAQRKTTNGDQAVFLRTTRR